MMLDRQPTGALIWSGVAGLALSMGCKTGDLEPASGANELIEGTAVERDNGMFVMIDTDAWEGDLGVTRVSTPILVTLDNDTGQAVNIEWERFSLRYGLDNREHLPLMLEHMNRDYTWRQHRSQDADLLPDPKEPVEWPMVFEEEALQEGVLPDGERRSGYLFFDRVINNLERFSFEAEFVDSEGALVADIQIPLTTEEQERNQPE